MARPHSLAPKFTPGNCLSRLPVRATPESLEDFYRDLFANPGPEHDRERLLRLLDEDVADGAAAHGQKEALDCLGQAFCRIDAWTFQGDFLPEADRAELKRRAAHNLLAVRPGLDLAAEGDGHAGPDRAVLRQVQAEHAAWRQGWAIGPEDAPYGRQPWAESTGPRQGHEPADALGRLGRSEPLDLAAGPDHDEPRRQETRPEEPREKQEKGDKKTFWYVVPKPTACDKCLAMAGKLFTEEPERPHPNCKCRIESRELTAQQAQALQDDLALQARDILARRERIEREEQAAKAKAKAPAYVDDSRWNQDGDPVAISGKDNEGRPVRRTFKGHVLPDKTPGGVRVKTAACADCRVTKEMSDTLQEVLDDPRCKEAGVTSVTISSTTNGKHARPDDRHYSGKAVDIAEINGKSIKDDAIARKQAEVLQEVIKERAKELGIKDNLGPTYMDLYTNPSYEYGQEARDAHKDHVHIAII